MPPYTNAARPFDDLEAHGAAISWTNAYTLMIANAFNYPSTLQVSGKGSAQQSFIDRYRQRLVPLGVTDAEEITDDRRLVDTEAVIGTTQDGCFVSFRGSEPARVTDLKSAPLDWVAIDLDFTTEDVPDFGPAARIHSGFLRAYGAVHDDVASRLHAIADDATTPPRIWITGHSLGGALAIIAGYRLSRLGLPIEGVYTFGAPHVGNSAFRAAYDGLSIDQGGSLRERTFAIVNDHDVIPVLLDREFINNGGYSQKGFAGRIARPLTDQLMGLDFAHVGRFINLVDGVEAGEFHPVRRVITEFGREVHKGRRYLEAIHGYALIPPSPAELFD